LRVPALAAAFGAAAFGLSPWFTDLSSQANVVGSAAWSGLICVSAQKLAQRPGLAGTLKLSVCAGLSLLAGSPETLLWQGGLAVLVAAATGRGWTRARTGLLAAGGVLGALLMSAITAFPALELALHSARGRAREDLLDWSTSLPQWVAFAWPRADFPRGPYWGEDQGFLVTVFAGTLTCAFALVSLRRSPRIFPFAVSGLLLALLSLGSHFAPSAWVLQKPPFVLFRYPSKYLVGVGFCLAVLAAQGVERAGVIARRWRPHPVRAATVVLGALPLLVLLGQVTALPIFRVGLRQGLPWVMGVLTLAVALAFALPAGPRRSSRLRRAWVLCGSAELLAYHLLQGGFGWEKPERFSKPSRLAALLPHPFVGRISLPMTDALVEAASPGNKPASVAGVSTEGVDPSGHASGYSFIDESRDALVPNRSQEEALPALEGYGAPEPERSIDFLMAGQRAIFDLTGVTYYVRNGPAPFPDLHAVPTPAGLPRLYRSETALPHAFVVQRARVVSDEEALARVRDPAEPTRDTAFLATGEALDRSPCASQVEFLSTGNLGVSLAVDACEEGYLVISDAFYPGWEAEVDGQARPVLRADVGLRAVRVGKGRQGVVFRYRPFSFLLGAGVSGLSLGVLGWAWRRERRHASGRRGIPRGPTPTPHPTPGMTPDG